MEELKSGFGALKVVWYWYQNSTVPKLEHCKTHSIRQSPYWEYGGCSASQESLHLLWNPKVRYCVHKSLPMVCILSQLNPVYVLPHEFVNIHFDIVLLYMLNSSMCSLPIVSFNQNFLHISHLHACYNPCPSQLQYLVKHTNYGTPRCIFLQSPATVRLLGPNILYTTPFSVCALSLMSKTKFRAHTEQVRL